MRNLLVVFIALLPWAAASLSQPARVGVSITQTRLTLQQAVDLALKNNLEIEIERTNVANAAQALRAALGAFDPAFRIQPGIQSANTPTASVLQGAGGKLAEHSLASNLAFNQRLPWYGSVVGVNWDNSRYSTSNSFASLNPTRSARLTVNLNIPLLRNHVIDPQRGEIRIRRKQQVISDKDFELRVIDVISRVEQAYWNLVAARQDAIVQAEGVNLAKEQLDRNQRMIAAGTLAPVELSASQAEYQRRLDSWYASVTVVTQWENALKTLIAPSREDSIWSDEIVPLDIKTREPAELGELKELVSRALDQRPELQQLALRRDVNDIQRRVAADQVKPQVNLVASYWNSGLGGDLSTAPNPFTASSAAQYQRLNHLSVLAGLGPIASPDFGSIPSFLVGGYGTALDNLFAGRYQSVQVGVAFDLNIRNRAAQASLAQTAIADKRLKLEQSRLGLAMEAQVRNALQSLQSTRQRIVASAASERAAQEKLESEIRLFQTGESTNFLVLTRQNELLDSRRRSVLATLDYNRALSGLDLAVGGTLRSYSITLK
jgi:HAE1 family hydrophobic/amphiphilic exporter-1